MEKVNGIQTFYSTLRMGHTQSLQTRMTNWSSEGCPLIILFMERGFTEDYMMEFISFALLPRKHMK